ncbi:MAG: GNAT family N-acetyltransferase [Chloroflexota bacterium]|nr:GNAT family N-acetyltransferase [Chloroflexota bacterium]
MDVTVRRIRPEDEMAWRELWAGYLAFYETTLPDVVTDTTWARIISTDETFQAIVAELEGAVIGFANVVLHDFTWSDRPAGLLHDLFVQPEIRGSGAGRALIRHVIDQGKREGWNRVYWMTKEDNDVARRLYDTFVPADGFVRYRVGL